MMNTDTTTVTLSSLPPVDSDIFVTAQASNVFGQGIRSDQVMTEISKLLIVLVDKKININMKISILTRYWKLLKNVSCF